MDGQDSKVTCLLESCYEISEPITTDTLASCKLEATVVIFPP